MTAIEYMEKMLTKHSVNYEIQSKRNVPEETLNNIECKIGYYTAAIDAIKGEMNKWISINDRVPPLFASVIGYIPYATSFPAVEVCFRVGNTFYFPALKDRHTISHWMPLPEPPKGENNG